MKLEVEITEAEITSAIERKVRTAIADQTNQWGVDRYIKDEVAKHWKAAVDKLIVEALNDSPRLREKIMTTLEAKLKAQLTAAMKAAAAGVERHAPETNCGSDEAGVRVSARMTG